MSGSLTGAHYTTLDQDDSEVNYDSANGQVLKFKNVQGFANAHNPDVFVGDTEDGTATVDISSTFARPPSKLMGVLAGFGNIAPVTIVPCVVMLFSWSCSLSG